MKNNIRELLYDSVVALTLLGIPFIPVYLFERGKKVVNVSPIVTIRNCRCDYERSSGEPYGGLAIGWILRIETSDGKIFTTNGPFDQLNRECEKIERKEIISGDIANIKGSGILYPLSNSVWVPDIKLEKR